MRGVCVCACLYGFICEDQHVKFLSPLLVLGFSVDLGEGLGSLLKNVLTDSHTSI